MLKIHLRRQPSSLITEVFVFDDERHGDSMSWFEVAPDGGVIGRTEKVDRGAYNTNMKPFFIADERFLRDLMSAFQVLAKQEHVKDPNQSFSEGKLEATSKHLEDMRKIVFEPTVTGKPL